MIDPRVREAYPDDAPRLAPLMGVLGYPADADAMRRRLERVSGRPDYATYLAEDERGEALGMIGVIVAWPYNHDAPFARILALVVAEEARGTGVGAALVRAAERWAVQAGAYGIHLTTATHRDGAHAFYQRIGYEATGTRFHKRLG